MTADILTALRAVPYLQPFYRFIKFLLRTLFSTTEILRICRSELKLLQATSPDVIISLKATCENIEDIQIHNTPKFGPVPQSKGPSSQKSKLESTAETLCEEECNSDGGSDRDGFGSHGARPFATGSLRHRSGNANEEENDCIDFETDETEIQASGSIVQSSAKEGSRKTREHTSEEDCDQSFAQSTLDNKPADRKTAGNYKFKPPSRHPTEDRRSVMDLVLHSIAQLWSADKMLLPLKPETIYAIETSLQYSRELGIERCSLEQAQCNVLAVAAAVMQRKKFCLRGSFTQCFPESLALANALRAIHRAHLVVLSVTDAAQTSPTIAPAKFESGVINLWQALAPSESVPPLASKSKSSTGAQSILFSDSSALPGFAEASPSSTSSSSSSAQRDTDSLAQASSASEAGSAARTLALGGWTYIGFQQARDPMSDFRGAGYFGLQCLLYLARNEPRLARVIFAGSQHDVSWYPFAIAGIAIAHFALHCAQIRLLQRTLHVHGASRIVLYRFFCHVFNRFHMHWVGYAGSPPLTVMDFEREFATIKTRIQQELLLGETGMQYIEEASSTGPNGDRG